MMNSLCSLSLLFSAASAFSPTLKTPFAVRMHRLQSQRVTMASDDGYSLLLRKYGTELEPNRRQLLTWAVAAAPLIASGPAQAQVAAPYVLPPLPYAYDALEPHIDAATMKFHHDFHHGTYVTKLNAAMAGKDAPSITDLQKGALQAGGPIRNCGGGHYNHNLFWTTLGPASSSGSPSGKLSTQIEAAFGSLDDFKSQFATSAANVFGSGWAWLCVKPDGSLAIATTPNQDNPLMDGAVKEAMIPILGLDVWEHAYYLKYQNRRPEYISAFWNVVNWAKVGEYYETAAAGKPVTV